MRLVGGKLANVQAFITDRDGETLELHHGVGLKQWSLAGGTGDGA